MSIIPSYNDPVVTASAAGPVPDSTLVALPDVAEIEAILADLSCEELDLFAYEALPALVVAGRPDLVYELILAWEDPCGTTEPVDRFRILAAVWDHGFDVEGAPDEEAGDHHTVKQL